MTLTPSDAIALIPPGDPVPVMALMGGTYKRVTLDRDFLIRLINIQDGAEVAHRTIGPPIILVYSWSFDADPAAWAALQSR